ncbi:MAG: hypothetical protein KDK97_18155, partial [Verrucomicrobiales bacterium]|nr:hypothetical protein [Verrucomicrobiales bacterium]
MISPYTSKAEVLALLEARHGDPFAFLGRQPAGGGRTLIRGFQPSAASARCVLPDGTSLEAERIHHHGLFELLLPPEKTESAY